MIFRRFVQSLAIGVFAIVPFSLCVSSQPTIQKDTVLVSAFTVDNYKGSYDVWSWLPVVKFRVNGPIESGNQLYVEFSQPGGTPWVKFDCALEQVDRTSTWKTECGGRDIGEPKGITALGISSFAIKLRNELAGTDTTLFTGKTKVLKAHSNLTGPTAVQKFVYYMDQDWNLPIGYVYATPDDVEGWKKTRLNVAFWVRGDAVRLDPHLFFGGKEVGITMYEGEQVGKPSCSADEEIGTTHYIDDSLPQKARWARVACTFNAVNVTDKTGAAPGMFGPNYVLDKNPGEYEVKVLWNNHLARSLKFTVASDGAFDNGIAKNNKLGSNRVIVPVTIIGDQDGTWDKNAWKADAFYGNPLSGFSWMP